MQSAEETKLRWHASVHDHVLALALSKSLFDAKRFTEAKSLLRERLSEARRALGAEADVVLHLHWNYAATLYSDDGASRDDVIEALAILEGLSATPQRIYGTSHPLTTNIQQNLKTARSKLASFSTPSRRACAANAAA